MQAPSEPATSAPGNDAAPAPAAVRGRGHGLRKVTKPAAPATDVPAGEPAAVNHEQLSAQVHFGDCVQGMKSLPNASVDLVIADPPYDIGVQKATWDTVPHYLEWSRTWLAEAERVLRPGGQLFIYGSPAKLWISRLKILAADEFGFDFKQHISWCYKQGGDARFAGMVQYAVRMEHLEWFVKPAIAGEGHTFNPHEAAEKYTPEEERDALAKGVGRVTAESLRQGRPPRNWVEIPRENSRSFERRYGAHPSMKPLKLCERLVLVHSNRGDRVLVPFGGSGSEVVAAAKLGRSAICFENDPTYHAIIVRRLAGHGVLALGADGAPTVVEYVEPPAAERTALGELERSALFTSGYKGVFKQGAKYVAKIQLDGTLVSIGQFESAYDAAVAYQARAVAEGHLPAPPAAALATAAPLASGGAELLPQPTAPAATAPPASALALVASAIPSLAEKPEPQAAQPAAKKRGRPCKQPAAPIGVGAPLEASNTNNVIGPQCMAPGRQPMLLQVDMGMGMMMPVVYGVPIAPPLF